MLADAEQPTTDMPTSAAQTAKRAVAAAAKAASRPPLKNWSEAVVVIDDILAGYPLDAEGGPQFAKAAANLRAAAASAGTLPFEDVPALIACDFSNLTYEFASAAGAALYPQYAINRDAMADLVEMVGAIQDIGRTSTRRKFSRDRSAELAVEVEQVNRALEIGRAWDAAVDRWARADAAQDAAWSEMEAADARAEASVELPPAEAWLHDKGVPQHVLHPAEIAQHDILFRCMAPEKAETIKSMVRAYWDARADAAEREGVAALGFAAQLADREACAAEEALMATPAPFAEGVALKVGIIIRLASGSRVSEPEDLVDLLNCRDQDTQYPFAVWADLQAMQGNDWRPSDAQPFDAEAWVDAAVAAGADISYGRMGWPGDKLAAAENHRVGDLKDWQQYRVKKVMERRARTRVDDAVAIYGEPNHIAVDGPARLYEIIRIAGDRWDLSLDDKIVLRDRLVALGYTDPLAVAQ